MRTRHALDLLFSAWTLLSLAAITANAQGAFIYDQQSATEATAGGGAAFIQRLQPFGQSFTPTLPSVGFIRLLLSDAGVNGLSSVVYVNLRSNSITGPVLGSTEPVFLPDGFGVFGSSPYTNFFFATPVPVNPG